METVVVDEVVRVGAAFDRRKIAPVWFYWKDRYYKVRSVGYSWSTSLGIARIHHYSVADAAGNVYELEFNTDTLEWTLSKVCPG